MTRPRGQENAQDVDPGTAPERSPRADPPEADARWHPSVGAWREGDGTRFGVLAPQASEIEVVLEGEGLARRARLERDQARGGRFGLFVPGFEPGQRYRFTLDGAGPFPDPASRFQPLGVHGPSEVVDGSTFPWTDHEWTGVKQADLVFYEIHVGTFTPEGTFAGLARRLDDLADLGVTALELMPIADFPGARNWGYDGAALFAPSHSYGVPDDLRRLVDAAHARRLAVYLDVVYNHLGPDGAYLAVFLPSFFSGRHRSPWGDGVNLDGPGSERVREFLVENALYWLHDFHLDGLRLDATHSLADTSPRHFLADLAEAVRQYDRRWQRRLVAEDERNVARLVRTPAEGGFGLDAVWADDFHHQVHVRLTGEAHGYYADYAGSLDDLAATINAGWFYTGQYSRRHGTARGTDPAGIPPPRFVFCLENHDQAGNRARGERLSALADPAVCRAATALLLLAPQTPLLFMGQEWAASTPFLYFTDHDEPLGRLVTEGRRREFEAFFAFAEPGSHEPIPDPQAEETFRRSQLRWEEAGEPGHAGVRRLHRALLRLRREEPALRATDAESYAAVARSGILLLARRAGPRLAVLLAACLEGARTVRLGRDFLSEAIRDADPGRPLEAPRVVLTTEDAAFVPDPRPLRQATVDGALDLEFPRPSAILLAWT